LYIQKVLKGIVGKDDEHPDGIDDDIARIILLEKGIICNWWHNVGKIRPEEIKEKLTDRNLVWHLNRYNDIDPITGLPFHDRTPFISTTAGAVERDVILRTNFVHSPYLTALQFATADFTRAGYIFYGYLFTLGKKSVEVQEFSEEVRELHIYTKFFPYQLEGEIVAKVHIPSQRLEKVERYEIGDVLRDLSGGKRPKPSWEDSNSDYIIPERLSNIRGFVE
jgi:hypothetical protein